MNQIDINANGQQIDQKKLIENTLIESIKNKENVTKERLEQAEKIDFKAIPEKVIKTDGFGFIKKEENLPEIDPEKQKKESLKINARIEKWNTMLAQYLDEKQNLADFEEALKDGLITEEQMQEALDTVASLEANYYRLTYIMYLLDMPNRNSKKGTYVKQYKSILEELKRLGADIDSIKKENSDALTHFKTALKALKNKDERC